MIVAPKASREGGSFALSIVRDYIDPERQEVIEALFPMTMDKDALMRAWAGAARSIVSELEAGRDVIFLTLGDPSLFSTYSYVRERVKALLPGAPCETVPGVSSVSLAAALAGVDLGRGRERLAVMPLPADMGVLKEAFALYDTVVLMKVSRGISRLTALLEEAGLLPGAVYVCRCGTDRERVIRDLKAVGEDDLDYLSIVIIKTGLK